jgi:LPS-assembly protein
MRKKVESEKLKVNNSTSPPLRLRGGWGALLNSSNLRPFLSALICIHLLLFATRCLAAEKTTINSESLTYDQKTSTYVAKGNVKMHRDDADIEADEITYNEQTSDAVATGDVKYTDKEASISASKAELNLDKKTGILYDARIFLKKDNYHLSGKVIQKRGEDYYFSPDATFTTCDAPVPAWCFKGKDVDALVEDRLKSKDTTFRIKDIPVLYAPYLQAPLQKRKTGFLLPAAGYSDTRGAYLNVPFFLVLSENRDVTLSIDEYSKRGLGESLEYRYVEQGGINGKWLIHHQSDRELDKEYIELNGSHEQRSPDSLGGFLNVNYVNEENYYREFNPQLEVRTNRFLESTGEISLPFSYSRAYFLSQYWVDLKENVTPPVAQRLPEAGYVLYPTNIGKFWLATTATVSNFWRRESADGQRLDVYPRLLHTFGDAVVVSQELGLRETAYNLQRNNDDDNPHREAVDYSIIANTRFLKKYASFTHVVEPSVGYFLISDSENDLPVFDSTELFKKTSTFQLSLLNRIIDKSGELLLLRLSEGYDTDLEDNRLLPLRLEVGLKRPVLLRLSADYDLHLGRLDSLNSDITMKISEITFTGGQRYNKTDNITTYTGSVKVHPLNPLYLEGRVWYDEKQGQFSDISFNIKYIGQCWAVMFEIIKNPDGYSGRVLFDLKGLGFNTIKP